MSRNPEFRRQVFAEWLSADVGLQVQSAVLAATTVAGLLLAARWAVAAQESAVGLGPGGFVAALSAAAWWHAACRGLRNSTPVVSVLMFAQATAWGAALTLIAPVSLSLAPLLLFGGVELAWRLSPPRADFARLVAGEGLQALRHASQVEVAVAENPLSATPATDAPAFELGDQKGITPETPEENWTQIQTRGFDAGSEYVRVQQRVTIAAGQRLAVFHVGFCPPLTAEPSLEFEQFGGPEARLRITELRPLGARVEVRLARTEDEDAIVEVEGYAVTAGRQESAA